MSSLSSISIGLKAYLAARFRDDALQHLAQLRRDLRSEQVGFTPFVKPRNVVVRVAALADRDAEIQRVKSFELS
jgi:hypothetical protein